MKTISFALILLVFVKFTLAQKASDSIDKQYKWDLTHIYLNVDDWEEDKNILLKEFSRINGFKESLTSSADNLLAYYQFTDSVYVKAKRLMTFASLATSVDITNEKYNKMVGELSLAFNNFNRSATFVEPTLLEFGLENIEGYIKENQELSNYKKQLADIFYRKNHILSIPEENIYSLSNLTSGNSSSVFSKFTNAEMPYPEVKLSSGEIVTINAANYTKYRAAENRQDRELVFNEFFNNFTNYKSTLGELLYGQVKENCYKAKARGFDSPLHSALFYNFIDTSIYKSLISNVNANLESLHRYLLLKKRIMKLDTIKFSDVYASVIKDQNVTYSYEDAKKYVLKSLSVLGNDYTSVVDSAFNNNWIDVYPYSGKRSGAFSNGSFYDGHPYILLNYNDLYDGVSTLTHELGHTMHSYYSNKNQNCLNADYSIFVAEVASTFNEFLLFDYMIKNLDDNDAKLELLMNGLNDYLQTLFRQTMFAEFELKIHELVFNSKPLTSEILSNIYFDLVKKYYGHESDVCFIDDYLKMEWAYIPHFYYNFYVYQYSTSFVASNSLAYRVLNNEENALENYLNFLKLGGSVNPNEALNLAGIDITDEKVFNIAIKVMNEIMDEVETVLKAKGL